MIQRLAVPALFFGLALAFFGRQLPPDRVLLPVDALFLYPPWQAYAAAHGVVYPENPLVADTILQNVAWKQFAGQQWRSGQPPLWNPDILAGQPFLAAGQNASLYPFSLLFWLLPVGQAYELFALLHLALAGLFMVVFLRALRTGWLGAALGGVTFAFSGFLIVSIVWPMMVSTAIWLPLLLAIVERLILSLEGEPASLTRTSRRAGSVPLWLAAGVAVVGLQLLAGHLEMSFYNLATAGLYAGLRLLGPLRRRTGASVALGLALLGMVLLGGLLAAVQVVPFAEAIGRNVRVGQVTLDDVQGYAFDRGQWWAFILPDFFGNPTHRTYLDLIDGEIRSAEHLRPTGDDWELRRDPEWGRRNYVEGTAYVGIVALVLAPIGALAARRRAWPLVVIAAISLLCTFGTPLYALVFYGLPGADQVHTPFRWVFPWAVCLAALAGLGADRLARLAPGERSRTAGLMAVGASVAGGALLIASALALAYRPELLGVADRLLRRFSELERGFPSGRAALSYELPQLVGLGLLLLTTGLTLSGVRRIGPRVAGLLLVALTVGDLFSFGMWFNPAGEARLLEFEPPALAFLRAQPGPFRIAALGPEDVLPANLAMRAGLQDVRGYDTIITRDYVDYLSLIEQPGALLYSKVEKLYDPASLASPLFHALNVRYVVSDHPLAVNGYATVFDEAMIVSENQAALPRAFTVGRVRLASGRDEALALLGRRDFDPRREVVLEARAETVDRLGALDLGVDPGEAEIVRYDANEVAVRVTNERPMVLVLLDAFDPGWVARIDGVAAPVFLANRAFRAVVVDAGEHEVRLSYQPLSFRLGLLLSAVGLVALVGLVAVPAWLNRRGATGEITALGRVVRNATAPLAANLTSRFLDLGLALVMFRMLGPAGVGAYTFAVVFAGYLDILVGYGLTTLVTRDAARSPERQPLYLGTSLAIRGVFWSVAALLTWLVVSPLGPVFEIGADLALAVGLLVLGLLPSSVAASVSALLQARERFDVPAGTTVVTALLKVTLGVGALALGWGFVGLAAVSIVTNVVTAVLLLVLARRIIDLPWPRFDRTLATTMLVAAYPLMLSQVLNALFFRIDALMLKPLAGEQALGWYSTAYRFIDAFQIIPSSLVLALFPMLARQADDREATARNATQALRVLLLMAFPIAVGSTVLAEPIIQVVAGSAFIPQSVMALQILIWYLPLSFVNGLVQYVLIARGRQRILTLAFAAGVLFNVAANLWLIPRFGYLGAAWVTVLSEAVLLVPFWLTLRAERVKLALPQLLWRPALASGLMGVAMGVLGVVGSAPALVAGALVYVGLLYLLGGVSRSDLTTIRAGLRH